MSDPFAKYPITLADPLNSAEAVTPNDAVDLSTATRAIFVGTAGDLRVTLVGGSIVTFPNAGAGWHPLRVSRVWATGTTASDIVGCS